MQFRPRHKTHVFMECWAIALQNLVFFGVFIHILLFTRICKHSEECKWRDRKPIPIFKYSYDTLSEIIKLLRIEFGTCRCDLPLNLLCSIRLTWKLEHHAYNQSDLLYAFAYCIAFAYFDRFGHFFSLSCIFQAFFIQFFK